MGWNPFKSVGKVFKKASAPLSLLNPALGTTAGLVGSIFDDSDPATEAQLEINDKNLALQREMNQQNQKNWQTEFDYVKEQNALTRQREDNAIQRQVVDAENAGLSPLAVAGTGGASATTVSSPPSAPEMRAPVLVAPTFQNDLRMQTALLEFASQAFLQDRSLSSEEKVVKMQTSTQRIIAVSQLENAKAIADSTNDTQLKIATNQLIELNRSNTAKEYQAKLEYFQKTISAITDQHGRFEYGKHDADTCRQHNEEISIRWAEFVKTLPADSLSKSQSDSTSVSGGLNVGKNEGTSKSFLNPLKGLDIGASGSYTKGKSDADSVGQSSSVRALIKSFWLRNENIFWIPKGGF